MACNCGKNRTSPTGYGQPRAVEQPSEPTEREVRSQSAARANANRGVNSHAPAGMTQSFQLQTRDGRTQSYGSKLEADAARIRAGGGEIRPI